MPEILRGVEILTGVFYFIFGLDGFLKKLPMPEPSTLAIKFLDAIDKANFILPAVKLIEILVGLCFIFAFQGPLAWCVLSPIVFIILGYHFFINKKEKLMPILILVFHLILFFRYISILQLLWH